MGPVPAFTGARAVLPRTSPFFGLLFVVTSAVGGCSSAPDTFPAPSGMAGTSGEPPPPPPLDTSPTGWAAVPDLGLDGTTGGEGGEVVEVSTTADFMAAIAGADPRIVQVSGVIGASERFEIGSNKTVEGLPGAEIHGAVRIDEVSNVIVRNLKIVGNDCADAEGMEGGEPDCSSGADAVTIRGGAHHVWVDHCDVSDGSDGNLDVTDQADYVTISWTKFSYSRERPGGHHFSNLVGGGDNAMGDAGHLRVTFHHDWWADRARERMPRVRYGQVHVFNSLYTATGNNYCVGVGFYANVLTENNVFIGVSDPVNTTDYSNSSSIAASRGNLYLGTTGQMDDLGTGVFTPPYEYALDATQGLETVIRNGAGPH